MIPLTGVIFLMMMSIVWLIFIGIYYIRSIFIKSVVYIVREQGQNKEKKIKSWDLI